MKKILVFILFLKLSFASGYFKDGIMYLNTSSKNNVVECTVQQLCNITLIKGDEFQSWIMTYGDVWIDSAKNKVTYMDNIGLNHIIIQSVGLSENNPVILIATNHQYMFNLKSVAKSKTNNYVFSEPKNKEFNSTNAVIDDGLPLDFKGKKLDYTYYMKGDTSSFITPIKVFNDGKKTYLQMPNNIDTTDLPTIYLFNSQGQAQQINNPRYRKPYFVLDGILKRIAIMNGSVDNATGDDLMRVDIWYGNKPKFWQWLTQQYDSK